MWIGTAALSFVAATPLLLGAQEAPRIPLSAGLTMVSAVEGPRGDYESLKRVERIDSDGVHLVYSTERNKRPVRRTVRPDDLASSRHYLLRFAENYPEVIRGTTGIGTSKLVFTELKTRGRATFACCLAPGIEQGVLSGTLKRVGSGPVHVAVIVNNERVELPAIHASGRLGNQESSFYFLDDEENPIALRWQVGRQKLQVIKLTFPVRESSRQIEKALAASGRIDVYGIYFDFGSAGIKAESEPVLKEIAAALSKNPSWKLSVQGHTDNVGGDAANMDLSRRRAAAVKDALVTSYRVAPTRLSTAGFGASHPKETNATLEGRARNRRVELVRL